MKQAFFKGLSLLDSRSFFQSALEIALSFHTLEVTTFLFKTVNK